VPQTVGLALKPRRAGPRQQALRPSLVPKRGEFLPPPLGNFRNAAVLCRLGSKSAEARWIGRRPPQGDSQLRARGGANRGEAFGESLSVLACAMRASFSSTRESSTGRELNDTSPPGTSPAGSVGEAACACCRRQQRQQRKQDKNRIMVCHSEKLGLKLIVVQPSRLVLAGEIPTPQQNMIPTFSVDRVMVFLIAALH